MRSTSGSDDGLLLEYESRSKVHRAEIAQCKSTQNEYAKNSTLILCMTLGENAIAKSTGTSSQGQFSCELSWDPQRLLASQEWLCSAPSIVCNWSCVAKSTSESNDNRPWTRQLRQTKDGGGNSTVHNTAIIAAHLAIRVNGVLSMGISEHEGTGPQCLSVSVRGDVRHKQKCRL